MSQTQRPHAIVIGLDCMTGIQTARILASHDIPVIAIASNPDHYCAQTNVCEDILVADVKSISMISTLEMLGPTLPQKAVLFPCTDLSVLHISQNRDRLKQWYHIALAANETVEMLMDKDKFYSYADENNLPIPRTYYLKTRADAIEAAGSLTYPCILKPPMRTSAWEQNTKEKVFKVASTYDLLNIYDRCSAWVDLLMVQEWIEGTDANLYSLNCYFDKDSNPLVTFVARKLRQWPPETGTSCLGEEVHNDAVLETSVRLFRSVGYRGLGYVEMKRDDRTGNHYIIEPNIGRPTGRSAISEAGGVPLLYTMYCDVLGLPLPTNREQKYEGVKWIHWRRDFQSALFYWKRGDISLKEWWQSWRGKKGYAIFAWNDLKPFIFDWTRALKLQFGGRKKEEKASLLQAKQQATLL